MSVVPIRSAISEYGKTQTALISIDRAAIDPEYAIQQTSPHHPFDDQHDRDDYEAECRNDRHSYHPECGKYSDGCQCHPTHDPNNRIDASDITLHSCVAPSPFVAVNSSATPLRQ